MVSPAFQDRRYFRIANISPGVPSGLQANRLHPRIAGVSPASGCTKPLMSEVEISTAFLFALRQSAGGTPAIRWSRLHFRIAGIPPQFFVTKNLLSCFLKNYSLFPKTCRLNFRERLYLFFYLF
ncbi:MAG: hypothetical protein LBP59_06290 [Planctomycetaceae bacterium]|nr:hypothetical protein [Planctomycetaceae bacterium]